AVDDFEVVLSEGVLEHFVARLDLHRIDRLHALVIEGTPVLLVLEQRVAMPFERCDHLFAIDASGPSRRVSPLVDDGVGSCSGAGWVGLVALAEVLHERLALLGTFDLRYSPGPGFGTQYATHDVGAGGLDHGHAQVGDRDLHLLVQAHVIGDAHGAYHVLTIENQRQYVGPALFGLLQGRAEVGQTRAREGGSGAGVLRLIGGAGRLAQRAFAGVAPGIVGGQVEVTLVRHGLVQVLPQHARAHPGAVALAEHVPVAILAGGVVGVGDGAEIEQAALLGALAGGDRHGAGDAAEQHGDAFVRQAVDVGDGLLRA